MAHRTLPPVAERYMRLKHAEAGGMYRLAVESSPNAVVMVDPDGKIDFVNKQAERLFGYKRKELLGKPVEILLPARFLAKYRENYSFTPRARRMGGRRGLFGARKDGSEVPVEIGVNRVKTARGVFVLTTIVDITERCELLCQLTQSEAMAAVGSMSAVMAHEISNPLGSIVLAARALNSGDLSDDDRKTASSVLFTETERLRRTLQDFLRYARPREPKWEVSDLNRQVSEIIETLLSDRNLANKVQLDISLDKKLIPFPYDRDQVRQVLWNLMLNGIQAMNGDGRLKVATAAGEREASFSIVDSGPGIAPKLIEKIFEPFFTTKSQGTGLGLAICQRIIHAHGGCIVAENAPRAGARFRIRLPLRPKDG